jgi:hypothetical protein
MFLTLTCDSYGKVTADGTPADPDAYDYQRAARDALHFSALFDRFIQNLRRFLGYDLQYFASVVLQVVRIRSQGRQLPVQAQQQAVTWLDLACRFVDLKWPHVAAKSRTSIADALATVTPCMTTTSRGKPEAATLRAVLYGWAFHKTRRGTVRLAGLDAAALTWARDHSSRSPACPQEGPDARSGELAAGQAPV